MSARLRVGQMLRAAVADGVAPAIAFAVSRGDDPPLTWFAGKVTPPGVPTGAETRFDLASLTKPLTTTTWILRLVDAGRLNLERPIGSLLPLRDPTLGAAPVWRLMNHTAGLPAHRRYFAGLGRAVQRSGRFDRARSAIRGMLARTTPDASPGAGEVYSDLGFMLLAWIGEAIDGPLDARWPELPGHGSDALHMRPAREPPDPAPGYAPTERCPLRERVLQGEVHDENAWVMGGIAGHAGTFGDLAAVHGMGRRWLRALGGDPEALGVGPALARACIDRRWMHPRGTRVLGWDTPTPGRSSAGSGFGRRTIGHLGFTGTSIWIDPDAEVVMVLLTNRVHPTRENPGIQRLRPALHDAAWDCIRSGFT